MHTPYHLYLIKEKARLLGLGHLPLMQGLVLMLACPLQTILMIATLGGLWLCRPPAFHIQGLMCCVMEHVYHSNPSVCL